MLKNGGNPDKWEERDDDAEPEEQLVTSIPDFPEVEGEPEVESLIDEARRTVATERTEVIDAAFDAFENMSSPRRPMKGDFIMCGTTKSTKKFKDIPDKKHLFKEYGRVEKISDKYASVRHDNHTGTAMRDFWKFARKDSVIKTLVFNDHLKNEYIEKRESNAFNLYIVLYKYI